MTQILEFRNKEKYCILKVNLNMDDLEFAKRKVQLNMLAEEMEAKEVGITIKDNNGTYYFIGVYKL